MPESGSGADGPEVTAAGIARLAGVGRAAVSNWRRRHPHFPQPVGGTETSPTFSLAAVEEWLRSQGKLAEVPPRERVWQQLESDSAGTAAALVGVGELLLDHPARKPEGALAEVVAEVGPAGAYRFLLGRYFDSNPRQYTLTPNEVALLMARLAGPAGSVLDPACGSGELLVAAAGAHRVLNPRELYGQEVDASLARLAALRLALGGNAAAHIRPGDALRETPSPDAPLVDAVLCHPPFNERNWGHEELAYDSRWEYGLPARTESELAWVQHALFRLRPGGAAVLLLPPAVASRRTGRRIRGALLRRGALRAVIALPAGAAPPHHLPLHLWVLRRPEDAGASPAPHLLFVDAGARHLAPGRETPAWPEVQRTVLDAWQTFDRDGAVREDPGVACSVAVIDLLDDDIDLAPARHLPATSAAGGAAALDAVRDDLRSTLRRTLELAATAGEPGADVAASSVATPAAPTGPGRWSETTVGELARAGAVELRTGGSDSEPVTTREGDVVVPLLGGDTAAHVVTGATAGESLARHTALLRPDPEALDPHFLAGFLRGSANTRQASSYASSASRLDVRRLRVPRLPLAEQRRYGAHFARLAAFEEALRQAGELGGRLAQGMYDGLTDGTLPPP